MNDSTVSKISVGTSELGKKSSLTSKEDFPENRNAEKREAERTDTLQIARTCFRCNCRMLTSSDLWDKQMLQFPPWGIIV